MSQTLQTPIYRWITTCRSCGSGQLWRFLDLGDQVFPRFPSDPDEVLPHAPLELVKCEACHLVQLKHTVDRDLLFRQFWYQSGISPSITSNLSSIAYDALKEAQPKLYDVVVDIGSNDGTLLATYPDTLTRMGFEPAKNMALLSSTRHVGQIIPEYFSAQEYRRSSRQKAKIITAIAMFYDLEDPVSFCRHVESILADDGIFIVQQNYLGLMLQNTAYDNVCHEHLMYYSLASMMHVLDQADLEVYRVELNNVNGGSFKTFICKKGMRPVTDSVERLMDQEARSMLATRKPYHNFAERVKDRAIRLRHFIYDLNARRKAVLIYGAGTRGSTIFQYTFPRDHQQPKLLGCVDNNPEKHGRCYINTGLKIFPREDGILMKPDYYLVLPYHVADEIIDREHGVLPSVRFIVPLPEFRVKP